MSGRVGRVTFLGTGTSHGVPMIGCGCGVCHSEDPRDRRARPSVYLQVDGGPSLLIDTTPDLRQQALTFGVARVDAVLYTHCHADHVMGLDDLRRFNVLQDATIPCYGDRRTMVELRRTFSYVFESKDAGGGVPRIRLHAVAGAFCVDGVEVTPVPVMHGQRGIFGYRVGGFAYLTDCSGIPDASWALLEDLDVLVIDALRHRPHPTHFSVAQALEASSRIRPRRTYLTHICHDLGHAVTDASLPPGVEMAWDGLVLEV